MFKFLRGYGNAFISSDGGLALIMMDGLLLIPLIMAAFFYPRQVMIAVFIVAVLTIVSYEAYVFWRRRHPNMRV